MDTSKEINKKVSVVLPCHNEAEWIKDCIESLFNQTYKNVQVVIIDDASEDNSFYIAKSLQEKYGLDKIVIHRFEKNKGEGCARNMGVVLSDGFYILQTDTDAIFPNDFIEKSLNYLHKNNVDSLSLGQLKVHPKKIGILANYWRAKRKATFLLRKNGMREEVMTLYFYTKSLWESVGRYEENVPLSTDFDFGSKARKAGFKNLWAEETFFWHADPTSWKIFFMRLLNGARFSMPIQKKWNRWMTPKQKIKEICQFLITGILLILGLLFFIDYLFLLSWLLLLIILGVMPIIFHKETNYIAKISYKRKYYLTLLFLPIITLLRTVASNLGKIYALFFHKKVARAITFDV